MKFGRTVSRLVRGACALALLLAPAIAAGDERVVRHIRQSGLDREYIVHFPADLGARSSWPVLMAFHPFFTTAEQFEATTRLHEVSGAENFIIVYPNGFRRSWNAGDCCGRANKRNIDDVGYFHAIMADLKSVAPVQDRAFITGFSNGGMMVYRLVCSAAENVAAAAPAGATIEITDRSCDPSRRVSILHIHGAEDDWAPLKGGVSEFSYVGEQPPVMTGIEYLAREDGCRQVQKQTLTKDVSCTNWSGCSGGAQVSLCIVPDLGHLWAGRGPVETRGADLGPARPDIDASSIIVSFFLNHM